MGRRKKEPESVHRENISSAAERLFFKKGIEGTTMDDIAKEAGYSKATLYVYFSGKEDVIGFLTLKSMRMLYFFLKEALTPVTGTKGTYDRICRSMMQYQEQYPLYFSFSLRKININFNTGNELPVEQEIYDLGEQINAEIVQFIHQGIEAGEFDKDIPILPTAFLFWGSLSGVIEMSVNKQEYIQKAMGMSKQQFLEFGFARLYRLIAAEET